MRLCKHEHKAPTEDSTKALNLGLQLFLSMIRKLYVQLYQFSILLMSKQNTQTSPSCIEMNQKNLK